MSDDQFTQLFKAITEVKTELTNVKDTMATKEQLNAVYDLLDKNIKEHERQEQERGAMAAQLTRHDRQIEELAKDTGTTLSY